MTEEFYKRINEFVTGCLGSYKPQKGSEKIIHDPIWGSVLYYGWEVQVIDSPLLQRLRNISQLGTAELTYTAARHSRFEHSLGTAAVAGRMISKLYERYKNNADIRITDTDVYKIRMAAILHDVGHCFYSHLSEGVYSSLPEFEAVRKEIVGAFSVKINPRAHELFSYMIITSEAFTDFFWDYIDFPGKSSREQVVKLLSEMANMVIGVPNTSPDGVVQSYLTAIINGEFDADKLDYTQRDSYTAGIAMTYGVERFLMKLIIYPSDEGNVRNLRLAIDADSLTTVEELIFNRNILYVYMYRHQKVLAAESCIRDIIYGMINLGMLSHPCDFLDYTDNDIEALCCCFETPFAYAGNVTLGRLANNIRQRVLPKRCCEITAEKILAERPDNLQQTLAEEYAALPAEEKTPDKFIEFAEKCAEYSDRQYLFNRIKKLVAVAGSQEYDKYYDIRKEFCDILEEKYRLNGKTPDFSPLDIHIVLPKLSVSKISFPLVYRDGKVRSTESIDYISDWALSFAAEKWKGYIFCSSRIDRGLASEAADVFLLRLSEKTV